ncbi:BRCA1-A complex subunit Abraxas 1 [Narcine bancroftii]|uniref:BRCA1-A complex subunit Abraxas 1 n=1 Tax=Narcine bancroftii TaxID=1343680 RepID=UPI0038313D65
MSVDWVQSDGVSGASVSGFVFGSLAFQLCSVDSDAEGFLLGEIKAEAKNSITDFQMDDVELVYTIDIQKHIPCYWLFSFYNTAGEVDETKLQKILINQEKNIIGWYKFRRNTNQTMTFRERLLHRTLQKHLKNQQLVFFLLTTKLSRENGSTHNLEYTLYKPLESFVQPIPVSVTNLGMSEQQDYKTFSGPSTAGGYCRAMKKHRLAFFDQEGSLKEVERIKCMYNTLQEELKTTCLKVEESERSVECLLAEVCGLREKLSEKKRLHTANRDVKEKWTSDHTEKNEYLSEALKKAFPHSKLLQSMTITRSGQVLPVNCYSEADQLNSKNTISETSKNIHISPTERANASGMSCKRKAKNCHNRPNWSKKRKAVRTRARQFANRVNKDSKTELVITGSENEDEVDEYMNDVISAASPTF